MRYYQKAVWLVLGFFTILLLYVAVVFQVDDMTLSKGTVTEWKYGWTLLREDGRREVLPQLPYTGKSSRDELLVLEHTIPETYFGKTLAFLSADQILEVWMDGTRVYQFGTGDVRSFGHTPGSVYNFIDIPHTMKEGKIQIRITSPYPDCASRISIMQLGERDVLILKLLKNNLFHIFCNLLILVTGLVFFLLFLIQTAFHQEQGGMQYLCGYCIVSSLYYFVETKVLHIFYGNQTFYSVLVFLCLMMMPFFIGLYYANSMLGVYCRRWKVFLGLVCTNILIQLVVQFSNLRDFMDMAVCSHALIALTVVLVGKSYLDLHKDWDKNPDKNFGKNPDKDSDKNLMKKLNQGLHKEGKKRDRNVCIGVLGLLFMGLGGTVDIIRMYVVGIGDMGKYSRIGTVCFSLIMLYQHFSQVVRGYANHMEEHADLLRDQVELMEAQNEQLKLANEQAEEARQDAIAANAAKGKFLAQMSHEIRTPINAVLGMDTMILRECKDSRIREYALDIQNAGENLLALINDILDFSKIESGKLEIIPVEYDFSSLIHDIANMISAKAKSKKLALNVSVEEHLPSRLLGDDVRIRQVLVNLLNNAVKYTQKGSVSLSVKGSIEGRKVVLHCAVSDTGIGIKEEDISRLFREFERIEEKRNRNIEGTGLGINITTQLLLLMGSRLEVKSVYGEGSRFFFTLEQQIVDSTPIGNLEERIRQQSGDCHYTSVFTAPEAKILVVDDNIMNLKVFVSLLKDIRMEIDVAESGRSCLELVSRNHYDLIFLDHMMPEMDGIETLHTMKELENSPCMGSPVVALTANAITGAKEMYLAEGFDAFLSKPIHPEKLEQMILKLLPRELIQFESEEEVPEEGQESDGLMAEAGVAVGAGTIADPQEEEEDMGLPPVEGIDWGYARVHLPDRELLLATVRDFYKILSSEADSLDGFYHKRNEDPKAVTDYRIKVHSMKSSANLIGAVGLGGMAKQLEYSARDLDLSGMEALHHIFLTEWRAYEEKLKGIAETEENKKPLLKKDRRLKDSQIEDDQRKDTQIKAAQTEDEQIEYARVEYDGIEYIRITGYLDQMLAAVEDMDMDGMDEAMAQLESFSYEGEEAALIRQLSAAVTNMDTDRVTELVSQLYPN